MKLRGLVPDFSWARDYEMRAGLADWIAGTILAILLIPQVMAYAQLAGLPPETGLYAALLPPVLYLLFGTSPFVSVGPVALISLVIAEAASGSGAEPQVAAAIIAIQSGTILAVLGAFGLGRLVNFVSEPVLLGFTAAVAILIVSSQVPTLVGTDPERAGNLPAAISEFMKVLPDWQPVTAAIGIGAAVLLFALDRYAAPAAWKVGIRPPWRQAIAKSLPLMVIAGAALIAGNFGDTVARVEAPSGGLPSVALPPLDPALWLQLLPSGLAVAVVTFVTAAAVAKSLAGSDRSALDTSREALALGLGNVGAAMSGGYAVGASLSRSALAEDSGAQSPLASVVAALLVLAAIFFLAPLLGYLPKTALAALVISAVFGLVKLREMRDVWRHDRYEGAIIAIAFAATLALGVELGLLVGALAAAAHHLWFSSLPRVTRVGTNDDGESFRSVQRDSIELSEDPALVVRIDRSIFFANAAFIEDEVFARIGQHEGIECLVLDMRAINTVDASGVAMLKRLVQRLHEKGIDVRFAAAHQPVADSLGSLNSQHCSFHRTVNEALDAYGVDYRNDIAPT
ncbi:SulP family inorganic anion transporter [Erythrobacter rubeus]|uniref:STAS domain-containing protein n=1 Tax=Erythrobacter rubeus TaxID=2760803 RepID=A0ABR8KW81_9SPHN|nr:SulP family inorganic anion transporter [Erythrobacter rubeus]MBD2843478.1 STAS domain-containing protein [Erythrobacter rubeus]